MKLTTIVFSMAFAGTLFIATDVQAISKKKHKTYLKLVSAYTQHTAPADASAPPMTGEHFIIIWNSATYPETFFWRGTGGWLACNMQKAHKAGKNYITEDAAGDQIHKGDTLELSPVTRGRFPIPKEIPATAKNTLFFKTGGSTWLSFPVKKISKK